MRRFPGPAGLITAVATDLGALSAGYYLAFLLRFEGAVPAEYGLVGRSWFPWILTVQVGALLAGGALRLTWRYFGLFEAVRLTACLAVAALVLLVARVAGERGFGTAGWAPRGQLPLGIIAIDFLLGLAGLCFVRVVARVWSERGEGQAFHRSSALVPAVLVGAGRQGARIAAELAARPALSVRPLCFLDDDVSRRGTSIHGVPVLGPTAKLVETIRSRRAGLVLITPDQPPGPAMGRMQRECEEAGVRLKVIADVREVLDGRVACLDPFEQPPDGLLPRPPVPAASARAAEVVRGQRVLVTGAGGSIGSELCAEICGLGPEALVLVEQAENSLFYIHRRLNGRFSGVRLIPCVADVCDEKRMHRIFAEHGPGVVFHAAAHKHVPLMETNPGEAVQNNVLGTRRLADCAHHYGASRFVFISTDKAVNPTSVMGVTKRIAELYVQALSQRSQTRYCVVRFGNVWGSAGSVVPIFRDQIARGGPVTITHPEMERYFMTIPEACHLVLQAARLGGGGEIFILDMGRPVRIVELAQELIRLCGLTPGRDIDICFTGTRPGEKLTEELAFEFEEPAPTGQPGVLVARGQALHWQRLTERIDKLAALAASGAIHATFREIVPEYRNGAAAEAGPEYPAALAGARTAAAAVAAADPSVGQPA